MLTQTPPKRFIAVPGHPERKGLILLRGTTLNVPVRPEPTGGETVDQGELLTDSVCTVVDLNTPSRNITRITEKDTVVHDKVREVLDGVTRLHNPVALGVPREVLLPFVTVTVEGPLYRRLRRPVVRKHTALRLVEVRTGLVVLDSTTKRTRREPPSVQVNEGERPVTPERQGSEGVSETDTRLLVLRR